MAKELSDSLLAALQHAVEVGTTIYTLSHGRPNRITAITRAGVWVQTERSEAAGGPELVDAWMLQAAWERLESAGSVTHSYLLNDMNIKRSSAVCALLAQLPNVRVASSRNPIELQLVRG